MEENLASVISKIASSTNLEEEEILKKIEEKEKEFEGLVSTLGAAYIVAKELGVKLNTSKIKESKIKDLFAGLGGVRIKAKILRVYPVNEFERKDGTKGRVMNVILGDETGIIRLSLWDDQIEKFKFKEGDVISIEGAYVKEGFNNSNELRLREGNEIKRIDEEIFVEEDLIPLPSSSTPYIKKSVIDFKEGERVESEGYVVRLFYKNPVFKYCPECKAKLDGDYCAVHGKVKPEVLVVVSGIFDDGTSSIIFNLFRDNAEKFIGMPWVEIERKIEMKGIEGFYEDLDVEMKKYRVKGVVKRSEYSSSLELYVNSIKEVNVIDNINKNLREMSMEN